MIQLKIKDYSKSDKDILFEILYNALDKYCYSVSEHETNPVNDCFCCPGKRVCRDIKAALNFIYK